VRCPSRETAGTDPFAGDATTMNFRQHTFQDEFVMGDIPMLPWDPESRFMGSLPLFGRRAGSATADASATGFFFDRLACASDEEIDDLLDN